MLLQPATCEHRGQIFLERSGFLKFRIHSGFQSHADASETEIGLVAKIPVVHGATCTENRLAHKSAVSFQHGADFIEGQFLPLFPVHQEVELWILFEARRLLLVHVHVGVGAHDFRIDGDVQCCRNLTKMYSLVERVDVGIFVRLPVGDILSGLVAFGGDADVHFRGTELTVDVLQLLRGRGGLVPDNK